MNNDLNDTQLENLLRGLPPAAASHSLVQRVDEELKLDMSWLSTSRRKPQRQPRWLMSAGWAAMGAAAAIAVMSYLPQQTSPQGLAATTQPASTIHEWDGEQESGIHHGRSHVAEARALVVSRELGTWVDPRYGAQLTMHIPSGQNLLTPVSYK
ncbi:MAG: hypothetical protein K9N47_18355 [Prosthecobacter sp.]|uniref:hypothetical protein n=1 Tax=Prosthecobacter sp. TaxID=1965333 RepID=UPI0025F3ABB8|nr:hypothetical protein [Prosthecobacter sp.]MCF7788091.1 hypothetical protein [Prosthecobacter sp.]